jgi:hypothetical protein
LEGRIGELTAYAEAAFRGNESATDSSLPQELTHIWRWFLEINEWRGFDRVSNLPKLLSIETISHWCNVTQQRLSSFELSIMLRLETAYWEALTPPPEETSTLFADLKQLAEQEGKIRTVPMNPKRKKNG